MAPCRDPRVAASKFKTEINLASIKRLTYASNGLPKPLLNLSCSYDSREYTASTMPVDWKADIPFKTFIARQENLHNRHSAAHANGSPIRSNSSMSQVQKRPSAENQPTRAQSPTVKENKEDLHDAEGTLEMQKMLLGKLARRENTVKGLVYHHGKRSMNGQRVMGLGWESSRRFPALDPASEADLEGWKREMAQALYTIWGPQGKSKSHSVFRCL